VSCPLNHRAAHRSYPQLWRSGSVQDRNRPVWPSDPGRRAELQACKLPTVWITPVDNYPARDVRRVPTPGNARKCKTHAGHGALWKTATSCGNALRRQGPDRPDVAECLWGTAAGRRSRPVTFTLTPPRPRKSVVARGGDRGRHRVTGLERPNGMRGGSGCGTKGRAKKGEGQEGEGPRRGPVGGPRAASTDVRRVKGPGGTDVRRVDGLGAQATAMRSAETAISRARTITRPPACSRP
jgi:hypothetical protein